MKAQSPRQPARTAKPAKATAQTGAQKAPAQSASKLKVASKVKAAAPKTDGGSPAAGVARKSSTPVAPVAPAKVAGKSATLKSAATAPATGSKAPAADKAEAAPSIPPASTQKRRKSIKEAAGVSTDAVARRTGKSWDDWFDVLDSAGAATLDQRGIVAILAQKHGIGPWWQQMIAVGYESLRSKSDKPPAADGFQVSSSCTIQAPITRVFKMWNDAGERARWLADDRFVVRGATADKVIRARWGKGTSQVAVSFSEKAGRTEVSVAHQQIETSAAAEQMKAYWAKKLSLLEQALEQPR